MKLELFSLYWDNIAPEVPLAQQAVCDALKLPINQHRIHGLEHGEWIDWTMARSEDVDVFLFIDIDCVPLNRNRVLENAQKAGKGTLIGAEGAANHLDPNRSYAGAWYTFIGRNMWKAMRRPSAKSTPHADICQTWTDAWRKHSKPLELIPPTHCLIPKWDLPGRKLAYGIGTTYGDDCFHLFEARMTDPKLFVERCGEIVRSAAGSGGT